MFLQVTSRDHDIAWTLNWKAVGTGTLKGLRHILALTVHQQRSNCIDGTKAHTRGSSGCENTEDEFFPKPRIRSLAPDFAKLIQSFSNLLLSRPMCGTDSFDIDEFAIRSH
jgi:hypothetical protein